jgi:hypothetical protein
VLLTILLGAVGPASSNMSKHDGAEELRLSPTGAEHDDRERLLEAEGERGETADKLAPVEAQETMLRNLVSSMIFR